LKPGRPGAVAAPASCCPRIALAGGSAVCLTGGVRSSRTGILVAAAAALAVSFGSAARAWAAPARPWTTLTNCEYVATSYNDGDSFRVRSGTNGLIVRLYFVDAPEKDLIYPERAREQSEHFGVTLDQVLKAGAEARDAVQALLQKPFVVRTRWANAAGRGTAPRYYALVEVDGRDLGEILVSRGLARAKGVIVTLPDRTKADAQQTRLRRLETEAREKKRGIWADSTLSPTAPRPGEN